LLAFEPSFVEIWHVETGAVAQIIEGSNVRLLFADVSTYSQDDTPSQYARDQIVFVSDDRVMTIRLVNPADTAGGL
jgi:hypothetical protein